MTLASRTIKDTLVKHLRDEIIRGDLVPGQRLRQEQLAELFGVSTMPVREALRDLEAEGLVTITPHRGAVVTELSAGDLEDIYDIRTTLEEMATRLAVPHLTEDDLSELAECVQEMDAHLTEIATLVQLNHRFHTTLYAASGRRHLCELLGILRHRTQHYLHSYITDIGGMPEAQAEHRAILEACQQGNGDRAATVMRQHVSRVGRAVIEYVRQAAPEND